MSMIINIFDRFSKTQQKILRIWLTHYFKEPFCNPYVEQGVGVGKREYKFRLKHPMVLIGGTWYVFTLDIFAQGTYGMIHETIGKLNIVGKSIIVEKFLPEQAPLLKWISIGGSITEANVQAEIRAFSTVYKNECIAVSIVEGAVRFAVFVMTRLPGEALTESRVQQLTFEQKISRLMLPAAEQLVALHRSKLLHLDLKINNFLYDCLKRTLFICDYGLAIALGQNMIGAGNRIRRPDEFLSYTQEELRLQSALPESDVCLLGHWFFETIKGSQVFDRRYRAYNYGSKMPSELNILDFPLDFTLTIDDLPDVSTETRMQFEMLVREMCDKDPKKRLPLPEVCRRLWYMCSVPALIDNIENEQEMLPYYTPAFRQRLVSPFKEASASTTPSSPPKLRLR